MNVADTKSISNMIDIDSTSSNSLEIFPWSERFNTGLSVIDEQHQTLVNIINKLADHLIYNSDEKLLNIIFDELFAYADMHFNCEEAIWKQYFPEDDSLRLHVKGHGNFIVDIERLRAKSLTKTEELNMEADVCLYLVRWLTNHILDQDMPMAIVVKALQSGMSRELAEDHAKEQREGVIKTLISIVLNAYGSIVNNTIQLMNELSIRKQAEQQLRIAAAVFESREGVMVTDVNSTIIKVNQAFCNVTGYTVEEVIGKNTRMLSSGRQDAQFYADMWQSILRTGSWSGEIWNRRINGEIYPEQLTITEVKGNDNEVCYYVGTFSDITSKKMAEEEIERLAFYDPLTNLFNRRFLLKRLKHILAASQRSGRLGALLFIDLDNFKSLNDSLGHDIGDLLLQQIANRLTLCVREADTIGRLGGDEFLVMLEDLDEKDIEAASQAEITAQKIMETLVQPCLLGTYNYSCTASIGITMFGPCSSSSEELLKHSDIAMYQAKELGRNTLCFFDSAMQAKVTERVAMEVDLRHALSAQQFQLYYQAQVNHHGHIIGAEVLLRWHHPQRGFVSPLDFIPLAEETNLILPIGAWVLEKACEQLKYWQDNEHTKHLQLSVNVSARQFHQADFVTEVHQVLNRSAINPNNLKLELTESLVLDDVVDTIHKMEALREIGVHFSMDDFGTGYSSLSSLKKLPLNQLKIDQSFVRDILTDPDDEVIVRTIISMTKNLNMEVIAEGVETEDQRVFLERHGCLLFQGYLFSKPVPIKPFEMLLKTTMNLSGSD